MQSYSRLSALRALRSYCVALDESIESLEALARAERRVIVLTPALRGFIRRREELRGPPPDRVAA